MEEETLESGLHLGWATEAAGTTHRHAGKLTLLREPVREAGTIRETLGRGLHLQSVGQPGSLGTIHETLEPGLHL